MSREIRFYRVRDPYGSFSNFSADMFILDGVAWPTVEHYYQAMKHDDLGFRDEIRACRSPKDAKNLAYSRFPKEGWDRDRIGVMRTALREKFTQHQDLRSLLISTGDAILVEASPWDDFWGCGSEGNGKNMLGELLMDLRGEFIEGDGHVGICESMVAGRISGEEAVSLSLEAVLRVDAAIPEIIRDAYVIRMMQDEEFKMGIESLEEMIEVGDFDRCHRGAFASFAFLVGNSPRDVIRQHGPVFNGPPDQLRRMCMWRGGCIRDLSKSRDLVGNGYDNCPSVHAAERMLYSLGTRLAGGNVVWVEVGILRGGDGEWSPWMIGDDQVYPCLQCLRAASNAGIKHLVAADISDPSRFRVCDVSAHASHILIRETWKAMNRS